MIALNADPATSLKEAIATRATTATIYVNGETPSNQLPDQFIEIVSNGPMSSQSTRMGVGTCTLMVIINTKLLSTHGANYKLENITLGLFQSLFASAVTKSGFTFSIDKKRMVYQGKSIVSGYSTKILNVITTF